MSLTGNLLAVFERDDDRLLITTSGTDGQTSPGTRFRVVFYGSRARIADENGPVLGRWPASATDTALARSTGFNPPDGLAEVDLGVPHAQVPDDAATFEVQQYTSSSATETWATVAAMARPSNGRSAPIPLPPRLPYTIDATKADGAERWDFVADGRALKDGVTTRGNVLFQGNVLEISVFATDNELIDLLENADLSIRDPSGVVVSEIGAVAELDTTDGEPYTIPVSAAVKNDVLALTSGLQLHFTTTNETTLTATIISSKAEPVWGEFITLRCEAGGNARGRIRYQWQEIAFSHASNTGTGAFRRATTEYFLPTRTFRCTLTRAGLRVTSSDFTQTWYAPHAIAGRPTIARAIASLRAGQTHDFDVSSSGGNYDAVDYVWSVVSGGGTITDAGVYTSDGTITADAAVVVAVTATYRGTGRNGRDGTHGIVRATASFTVTPIPSLTVRCVADNYNPVFGDTVQFGAEIGGTVTGSIAYRWELLDGGSWLFLSDNAHEPVEELGDDPPFDNTLRVRVSRGGLSATSRPLRLAWTAEPAHTDFGAFAGRKLTGGAFAGRKISGGAFGGRKFTT